MQRKDFAASRFRTNAKRALTALVMAGVVAPASAAEDYCLVPRSRNPDANATQALRQFEATADPRFMRLLNGVWFRKITSGSQTSNQYTQYQTNGIWGYTDFTCQAFCTRVDGAGVFAVRANTSVPNGFFGVISFSDTAGRDHVCFNFSGRFLNQNAFVDSNGFVYRRVQ